MNHSHATRPMLASLAALTIALTACGGNESDTTAATAPAPVATEAPTTTTAPECEEGQQATTGGWVCENGEWEEIPTPTTTVPSWLSTPCDAPDSRMYRDREYQCTLDGRWVKQPPAPRPSSSSSSSSSSDYSCSDYRIGLGIGDLYTAAEINALVNTMRHIGGCS